MAALVEFESTISSVTGKRGLQTPLQGRLARDQGFEPRSADPESAVIPIRPIANKLQLSKELVREAGFEPAQI